MIFWGGFCFLMSSWLLFVMIQYDNLMTVMWREVLSIVKSTQTPVIDQCLTYVFWDGHHFCLFNHVHSEKIDGPHRKLTRTTERTQTL